MSGKKLAILLGLLCIILFVGNGFVYLNNRNGEPEITFTKDVPLYTNKMSDEELLANVKASDAQDGDLTNEVKVDQIVKKESYVKVTYLVKDSDHNIVTETQRLERKTKKSKTDSSESGVESEGAQGTEAQQEVETQAEVTPTEKPAPEEAGPEAAEEAVQAEEPTSAPAEPENPEAPVITLNADSATVKVGESFQYGNYIDQLADDKDSLDTLGRAIHVDGADTTTPGVKEVHYYVMDSDGNKSQDAIFTLTVEE